MKLLGHRFYLTREDGGRLYLSVTRAGGLVRSLGRIAAALVGALVVYGVYRWISGS